jgi:phosphatidate cytidylyltransferase
LIIKREIEDLVEFNDKGGFTMNERYISAIIALPLLLIVTIAGGNLFKASVIILSGIALYEYINAYKNTKSKAILGVLGAGFLLYYPLINIYGFEYALPVVFLIVILSLATPIFNKNYDVISSSVSITGFIYIVGFFSLLILTRDHPNGDRLIWLVFIIAWCSDTFAYFAGRAFGKRKLCPIVSPKKTVEGSIGGILGCVVGVIIWGYLNQTINFEWVQLIILAVFGSMVAQIGDLSASLIKRYIGIKDYGKIMPGHGGILDRFDSILFVAPIVYYYIVIFLG